MAAMEKNNKTLNVPHLRFPEFSGEWDRFRNCALFKVISEKNKNYEFSTVLSASQTEGMVLRESLGIDIKFEEDSIKTYKIVRNGDYIAHLRSFQGGFAFSDKTGVCSPAYTILRPSETISYGFLKPYFMSRKFIDSLRIVTYGIRDGKSISVDEWLKLYTSIPKVNEQEKISKFLKLINERIETQKKIIEKYESLIRGLYQLLFQNAKYNDFVSLGDISQISNGNSDVKDASMDNDGSLYPFFDRSDEIKFLPEYLFDKEAIIYPGEGAEFYPRYYNGKFALHQRCYAVYDISTDFIPRYLYHYCKTQNSYFVRNAVGSTVASLRLDTFKRLKIPAIPTHHQESLVMFLDKIEAKIECNRTILKKYEEQKKYLLFTLFI